MRIGSLPNNHRKCPGRPVILSGNGDNAGNAGPVGAERTEPARNVWVPESGDRVMSGHDCTRNRGLDETPYNEPPENRKDSSLP